MKESLLSAINAIETAPEDADFGGIVDYCHEHGLPESVVLTLVQMPGDTNAGRLAQALAAVEAGDDALDVWLEANTPTEPEETDESDDDETSDGNDDDDSGDGSETKETISVDSEPADVPQS